MFNRPTSSGTEGRDRICTARVLTAVAHRVRAAVDTLGVLAVMAAVLAGREVVSTWAHRVLLSVTNWGSVADQGSTWTGRVNVTLAARANTATKVMATMAKTGRRVFHGGARTIETAGGDPRPDVAPDPAVPGTRRNALVTGRVAGRPPAAAATEGRHGVRAGPSRTGPPVSPGSGGAIQSLPGRSQLGRARRRLDQPCPLQYRTEAGLSGSRYRPGGRVEDDGIGQ